MEFIVSNTIPPIMRQLSFQCFGAVWKRALPYLNPQFPPDALPPFFQSGVTLFLSIGANGSSLAAPLLVHTWPIALFELGRQSTIAFWVTYGCVGLESILMELVDQFGDDANDFDSLGMIYTAWGDTYVTACNVEGQEWMKKLIV
jgi:hypothetical protein